MTLAVLLDGGIDVLALFGAWHLGAAIYATFKRYTRQPDHTASELDGDDPKEIRA